MDKSKIEDGAYLGLNTNKFPEPIKQSYMNEDTIKINIELVYRKQDLNLIHYINNPISVQVSVIEINKPKIKDNTADLVLADKKYKGAVTPFELKLIKFKSKVRQVIRKLFSNK